MPFDYSIPSPHPPHHNVVDIQFVNQSGETVQMYWHDWNAVLQPYGTVADGGANNQGTYVISVWSPHPPGQPDAEGFLINGSEVWTVPENQQSHAQIVITKKPEPRMEEPPQVMTDMELELVNYSEKDMNVVLVDGRGNEQTLGRIAKNGDVMNKVVQTAQGDDVKVFLQDI